MDRRNPEVIRRSRIFYSGLFIFFLTVTIFLLWTLKTLILPILIGMVSAYICVPVLNYLINKGIPRSAAFIMLFGAFSLITFLIVSQIVSMIPDEKDMLDIRMRLQYRSNEQYLKLMGKSDFNSEGNFLDGMLGSELESFIIEVNKFLSFDESEEKLFLNFHNKETETPPSGTLNYYSENKKIPFMQKQNDNTSAIKENAAAIKDNSHLSEILDEISLWTITPFVFLFMLFDDGEIKRFIINLVPNRYFEMALTTFENIDRAVGSYLRGTFLESLLVGITFSVCLLLLGFDIQASLIIGAVAGITNAIPFLGPVIGAIISVVYTLLVENINPVLPFMNSDNVIIGVIAAVFLVQLIDNIVYTPLVLGKAVNLHPIVVIIAIAGGSLLWGFAGMLFIIPAIVVLNVFISTIYTQLKDYFLIY